MEETHKQFKEILDKSRNILIITHKGPDIDAFCSALLLQHALRQLYPEKNIQLQTKQNPSINLPTMKEIDIRETLDNSDFDTLIITDAGSIDLCTDENDNIQTANRNIVIVDHHDTIVNQEEQILLINNNASSATEEIFTTLTNIYGNHLEITKEIAQLAQYGIVADTGRFLYDITTPNSLRIFANMMEISPIDMEEFTYKNEKFPREATSAIQEYLKTLTIEGDMAYMYTTRELIESNLELKKGLSEAQSFLRDKYLRYIQGVHWGFIIKPDMDTENQWFISFRSTNGYQDVKTIAEELGGGGHIYASGSIIIADSVEEVLQKTLAAITKHTQK